MNLYEYLKELNIIIIHRKFINLIGKEKDMKSLTSVIFQRSCTPLRGYGVRVNFNDTLCTHKIINNTDDEISLDK